MALVVSLKAPGGPELLVAADMAATPPGRGEVRVRHKAAGVNFVDIYQRTGLYPLPQWPAVLGVEAAGVVEAVGEGVVGLAPGRRVAWAGGPPGGYAETRNVPAERLMPLPDNLSFEAAGSSLLRAMTAHMVLNRVASVRVGQTVLVHAAAGGLGLMLTQWARRMGAVVIGTVSNADKAALARAAGADPVIVGRDADFVAAVRDVTAGEGVDLAVDGIGGAVLRRTLDAVRPLGMVVSLGHAAGGMPALDIAELGPPRSIGLARPSVLRLCLDPALYRATAAEALVMLAEDLTVTVGARFPLAEAAQAHRALESGATAGSVVLIP